MNRNHLSALLISLIIIMLIALVAFRQMQETTRPGTTVAWDYEHVFAPAARAMMAGEDPYQVHGFYNPFWTLIVVMPFALMPAPWGWAAFAMTNILLFTYSAHRLGVRNPLALSVLIVLVLWSATLGNVEGYFLWGSILPPSLGIFFLMSKPQTGLAVLIVIAARIHRQRGMVGLSKLLLPLLGGFVLSVILFDGWFVQAASAVDLSWNVSWFPWSLAAGLPLLWLAIRKQSIPLALIASPFFAAYIQPLSYMHLLVGLFALDWREAWNVAMDVCKGVLPLCEVPRFLYRQVAR